MPCFYIKGSNIIILFLDLIYVLSLIPSLLTVHGASFRSSSTKGHVSITRIRGGAIGNGTGTSEPKRKIIPVEAEDVGVDKSPMSALDMVCMHLMAITGDTWRAKMR
mmetsp:Transcript_26943/g.53810  ORF Transcript_26943/g.53810 Transcript_26943/m.53810 type:complete len:107 (-) Transcript_26943:1824-2144(-)